MLKKKKKPLNIYYVALQGKKLRICVLEFMPTSITKRKCSIPTMPISER